MIERIRQAIPLGRWGEPEVIAFGVATLCDPNSSWVTGEILRISGGMEGVAAAPQAGSQPVTVAAGTQGRPAAKLVDQATERFDRHGGDGTLRPASGHMTWTGFSG